MWVAVTTAMYTKGILRTFVMQRRRLYLSLAAATICGIALTLAGLDASDVIFIPIQVVVTATALTAGVLVPLFAEIVKPADTKSEHSRREGKESESVSNLVVKFPKDDRHNLRRNLWASVKASVTERVLLTYVALLFAIAFVLPAILGAAGIVTQKSSDYLWVQITGAVASLVGGAAFILKQASVQASGNIADSRDSALASRHFASVLKYRDLLEEISQDLSGDITVSKIPALLALAALANVSDGMAEACRGILQSFITVQGSASKSRGPARQEELELAVRSWALAHRAHSPIVKPLDLSGLVLDKFDLAGLHLPGVNLEGASLAEANLSDSDLSGAKLVETSLVGCNGTNCRLRMAVIERSDLSKAILSEADFTGAMLTDSILNQVTAYRTNFSRAAFMHVDLSDSRLIGANFSSALLAGISFNGSAVSSVSFAGAAVDRTGFILSALRNREEKITEIHNDVDLRNWLLSRSGARDG